MPRGRSRGRGRASATRLFSSAQGTPRAFIQNDAENDQNSSDNLLFSSSAKENASPIKAHFDDDSQHLVITGLRQEHFAIWIPELIVAPSHVNGDLDPEVQEKESRQEPSPPPSSNASNQSNAANRSVTSRRGRKRRLGAPLPPRGSLATHHSSSSNPEFNETPEAFDDIQQSLPEENIASQSVDEIPQNVEPTQSMTSNHTPAPMDQGDTPENDENHYDSESRVEIDEDEELSGSELPPPFLQKPPTPDEAAFDDPADYIFKKRFAPMPDAETFIKALTKNQPQARKTSVLYELAVNTFRALKEWQDEYINLDTRTAPHSNPPKDLLLAVAHLLIMKFTRI
jgi:hypothetical protein